MEDLLKNRIPSLYKLVSIEKSLITDKHIISYVDLSYRYDKSPIFSFKYQDLNLKVEMRDYLISELLNSKEDNNDLSVNEDLYTPEQRERIKLLRNKKSSHRSNVLMAKIEWSKQFNVGDRVYYKGEHGVISFKHHMKSDNNPQEFSVICGDTEYRYITGALLRPRNVEDLSSIPIDKELDKLDTERLLKMYKRSLKVNKGLGNKRIKRILNERENLNKVEKVINVR
jgi:hypothetical protein